MSSLDPAAPQINRTSLHRVRAYGVSEGYTVHMAHDILIVEDERNIALSLEFLMKQAGHTVRSVGDGQDALDAVAESLPDLILLDVNLPTLDGYAVCTALRADERTRNIRVLMLTARGREIEREKGLAAGADDYLTKPFSTRDLVQRVESLLDKA